MQSDSYNYEFTSNNGCHDFIFDKTQSVRIFVDN